MKYFITGATGLIGQHLCEQLIREGHDLTILVRPGSQKKVLNRKGVSIIEGDLSLFKNTELILPAVDIVIHMAAVVSPLRERDYFSYNFESVVDMVSCLRRQSWKPRLFLFVSSLAAAGPTHSHTPLIESSVSQPVENYGVAKRKAEDYLLTVTDFPVNIIRPPIVLAPQADGLLRVSMKMAKLGYGVKAWGTDQVFSFIYIDDLIDAMVKLTVQEAHSNEVYFVCANSISSQSEMWNIIGDAFNKKVTLVPIPGAVLYIVVLISTVISRVVRAKKNPLNLRFYKQFTASNFICSSEKLQRKLSWEPQYNLKEAITSSKKKYIEMGILRD